MHSEYIEEFHFVVEHHEPVEREVAPLEQRILDRNLWQGVDWHFYDRGLEAGELGFKPQSENYFYQLGYKEAQEKYK